MLRKIKIKKIEFSLILLVVLQIFLLTNITVANSYFIHQTDPLMDNFKKLDEKKNNEKIGKLVKSGVNLLIGFFSIKQIGIVSAQGEEEFDLKCCVDLSDGSTYQGIPIAEAELCEEGMTESVFDTNSQCKLGCCYDSVGGFCSPKSAKVPCESGGGVWSDSATCNPNEVQECMPGCCVFGGNADIMLEKECEKISELYNYEKEFHRGMNELECSILSASEIEGACMLEEKNCRRTTEQECLNIKLSSSNPEVISFHPRDLCSHESLEAECNGEPIIKQDYIDCVEGHDEIYWFDSCGNMENIYFWDRDDSWNGGEFLSKEQSCNGQIVAGSNNPSDECGNCFNAFPHGSKCASSVEAIEAGMITTEVKEGGFICKNLNCPNAPIHPYDPINGVTTYGNKVNGESWCLYDGYIGEGKDTVGSESWKAYCNEGEVSVDRCGEFRNSICSLTVTEMGAEEFSVGSCIENMGPMCLTYNEHDDKGNLKSDAAEKCENNKHCYIQNVKVDTYYKFSMCVPKYPVGNSFSDEYDSSASESICSMGSNTCEVKEEKYAYWEPIDGFGQCTKKKFPEQLHNLCITLGDCGTYVNFVGEGSNNEATDGDGGTDKYEWDVKKPKGWETYKEYATPDSSQFIPPLDLEDYLGMGLISKKQYDKFKLGEWVGWTAGGIGSAGLIAYVGGGTFVSMSLGGSIGAWSASFGGLWSAGIGSFGVAAAGFVIGAAAMYFLLRNKGITGPGMMTYMVLGGIAGGALALALFSTASVFPYGTIVAIVVAVIIAVLYFGVDFGKTRDMPADFYCKPWQPPLYDSEAKANEQCRKCNEDSLRPCTTYRCKSLGQTCELLNAGIEENPICESIPYDGEPPIISSKSIPEPFKFTGEQVGKGVTIMAKECMVEDSSQCDCIPEYTKFNFTLKTLKDDGTEEFAQCKYSTVRPTTPNYEDMQGNHPGGKSSYNAEHTFTIITPSIHDPSISDYLEGDIREQFSDFKVYVKCIDHWGTPNYDEYIVNFCMNSGPDGNVVNQLLTTAIPTDGSTIEFGVGEKEVNFYINEPAECKYDYNPEIAYDSMTYTMTCQTGIYDRNFYGWPCTAMFNFSKGDTIYMKCKDQPWPGVDDSIRNINTADHAYNLYVSETPLNITSVSPSGKQENGFEPIDIDLEVRTSGGSDHGSATCYYGLEEGEEVILFYPETGTSSHKTVLENRYGGTYKLYIKCEDSAGNIVRDEANFEIRVDDDAPIIVRAFNDGGTLRVITDEEAECYYDLNQCNFNFEDATKITSGRSTEHSTEWLGGITYHIKCVDLWENTNPGCAIKVIATK